MSEPPSDAGRRIGRYRLLGMIGHGGMAQVHLASIDGLAGMNKLLVVKRLRREHEDEHELVAMLLDEARIGLRLMHPNVVQTHAVDMEDGLPFIAMEYLDGQPLHRVLRRFEKTGGIDRDVFLWSLCELLQGLHHAHELRDYDGRPLKVIHRDVNPQNVFVTYHGVVKLMDFGIAKALDSLTRTETGHFKGKLAYMAPEQARGGAALDRRVDVFSVGVMMWEALTGERMWARKTDVEVATALGQGWVPPLPDDANIPPALRTICERAVAADRDQRWPDARSMSDALREWLEQHGRVPRREAFARDLQERFEAEREQRREMIRRCAPNDETSSSEAKEELPPVSEDDRTRSMTSPVRPATVPSAALAEPSNLASTSGGVTRRARVPGIWMLLIGAGLASAVAWAVSEWRHAPPSASVSVVTTATGDVSTIAASETETIPGPGDPPRCVTGGAPVQLSGEIERDATLTCDRVYLLRHTTRVPSGVTLTIEAGTTILGDPVTRGMLVIEPGGTLHAQGRPDAPIVFTSAKPPEQRRPGDWGGVLILGRAPINLRDHDGKPILGQVEGLAKGGRYGGDDPDDDSGVLSYLRIEYSGVELAPNNEVNGLTLAGVGRGTQLDHVQVRHAADDCFELFGGTVDGDHLLCDDPGDEGFDWDLGYRGTLRYLVVRSEPGRGQHGIEGDNDPGGDQAEPRSRPKIANLTLCGAGPDERYGLMLRRGTDAVVERALVLGFTAAVDIRDRETSFEITDSILGGKGGRVAMRESADVQSGPRADDDGGLDEAARLLQPRWRNTTARPGAPSCWGPAGEALRPSAPLTTSDPADDSGYVGAFRDRDDRWDEGWAIWSEP